MSGLRSLDAFPLVPSRCSLILLFPISRSLSSAGRKVRDPPCALARIPDQHDAGRSRAFAPSATEFSTRTMLTKALAVCSLGLLSHEFRTFRRPRHACSAPAASPVQPNPSTAASAVIPAKSRFSKCNGNSFRYLSQKRRFHPVPPEIRVLLPLEFESWRIKQNIVSCFVKSSRIFTLITPLKPAPHSILTLYAQNEKKDEEYGDPVKSAQAACPQLHTAICTWRVEMSRHDSTGSLTGHAEAQKWVIFTQLPTAICT